MSKGLLISVEGNDGAGKTTQVNKLEEHLTAEGIDFLLTREPGGTRISEKIREIILDPKNQEMTALTEAFLYASSRAQHVVETIRPALEKGKLVICDRFTDSSIAYQGYGRQLGEKVRIINEVATDHLSPDLTLLFLVNPEEGKKRISHKELDRLEMEAMDYHWKVYNGYKKLAEENPDRIVIIDGTKGIEEISREIIAVITAFITAKQE